MRGLLADVEKSGDPANELPRIDQKVRTGGGFLAGNCHILMHEVGRTWARRHGVTLETMFRYVPKSNDPGCSAGIRDGHGHAPRDRSSSSSRAVVVPSCMQLPTRFREYTCFHGSGHAFMRGYHGQLRARSSPASHSARASLRTVRRERSTTTGFRSAEATAPNDQRALMPIRARSARATPSRARAGTGSSGNGSSLRPSPTRATSVVFAAESRAHSAPDASAALPSCWLAAAIPSTTGARAAAFRVTMR